MPDGAGALHLADRKHSVVAYCLLFDVLHGSAAYAPSFFLSLSPFWQRRRVLVPCRDWPRGGVVAGVVGVRGHLAFAMLISPQGIPTEGGRRVDCWGLGVDLLP